MPVVRTFRHLGNHNKDDFCFKLFQNNEYFNLILDTDDVNRQVNIFTSTFIDCLDECAPYVTSHETWKWDSKKLKFDRVNIALQEQY